MLTIAWRQALPPTSRTATAVGDAVGGRAVPRHADEERAVVAEVGGPPVLRLGHDLPDVAFDGGQVEAREGLGVVEVRVQGVTLGGVRVQDAHVQLVGPPVAVRRASESVDDGTSALGLLVHVSYD